MLAEEKIVVFWGARGENTFCTKWRGKTGSGLWALGFGKSGLWPRGKWGKMVDEIGL